MSIFVFDIETIPDIIAGRKLFNLHDSSISDAEVAELMFRKATEETGQSFVRLPLHQVVAISAVYRTHDQLKVWSLGSPDASEKELVQRFFDGIEKYTPQLVSWNGQAFDLPVLQYRALLNQVVAKRYWDTGELDSNYKWNNYISRYHQRHLDLMDVLASYQPRAYSRLDDIATLLGFPGKMGMDGSKVWHNYQQGKIEEIRNYCETDVINTYLVYLRFQQMRGYLLEDKLEQELSLLKDYLRSENKAHLTAFLQEWEQA
ncbi:3'-5' exonuclease [Candidatus Berkiella cookevillensis]|uniref:3'-5' exonuclease n=1 Tax=Candidatus Berkiella cookevillensis TaxID=437022 RepID=A0A0Q9YTF8_9GAMM|nr:3'-5' exonuclease [Candidatus Berkiella cookevillensis]MCS5708296.1 3'-5' exonuclease [Candidatus Berkiella cookevillensis]